MHVVADITKGITFNIGDGKMRVNVELYDTTGKIPYSITEF